MSLQTKSGYETEDELYRATPYNGAHYRYNPDRNEHTADGAGQNTFPSNVAEETYCTGKVPPQTTFWAYDQPQTGGGDLLSHYDPTTAVGRETFDHFWAINSGVCPPLWDRVLRDDPWVVPKHHHHLNDGVRAKRGYLQCLSDQFASPVRHQSIDLVMGLSQQQMNRYNRHYSGLVGTFLSAVLTARQTSRYWPESKGSSADELIDQRIRQIARDHDIRRPARLIEMARRTWEEVWE